ncbi:MAG: polysaccharide deacetylase family protein [Firmicutes bacterium]|nr:polysaccharide deacetylase family protein [Bacillota bacterium]
MKRSIVLLLAVIVVLSGFFNIIADNYGAAGYTLYSDIAAYINNYPIQAYNIDGETVVLASDLKNYGFDISWNAQRRAVSIARSGSTVIIPQTDVYRNAKRAGQYHKKFVLSDIAAEIDGIPVKCFNIENRAAIYFKDLDRFGKVEWNAKTRAITLTVEGLPIGKETETRENPDVTLMYAMDGRTIVVGNDDVEAYKNVGWYTDISDVTSTLYANDGRSITVFRDEIAAYLKVGWFRTRPGEKMIALTFDDGPSRFTGAILDQLERYNSKATFFVVGSRVGAFSDVIKRENELGMAIGSHSWDHSKLTKLSKTALLEQKNKTNNAISAITGSGTSLLRPPYGATNQSISEVFGMPIILWSVDTLDWKTRDKDTTVRTVMNSVKDGDIVLMHDIYKSSADAAIELIPKLIDAGYKLVTVEELAEAKLGGLTPGQKYSTMR